jgi:hypothetical protein
MSLIELYIAGAVVTLAAAIVGRFAKGHSWWLVLFLAGVVLMTTYTVLSWNRSSGFGEQLNSAQANIEAVDTRLAQRHLTLLQIQALTDALQTTHGKINVSAPLGSKEAVAYAGDFLTAFTNAKWNAEGVDQDTVTPGLAAIPYALIQGAKGIRPGVTPTFAPDTIATMNAMAVFGITPTLIPDRNQPQGSLQLWIGAKQ